MLPSFISVNKVSKNLKNYTSSGNSEHNSVAVVILGGGQGKRLFPLTLTRCKPAISFGGKYRLIDVPISNSLNSGFKKIFILTQFLSASLHQHIFRTYHLDEFSSSFIQILAAEEKPEQKCWFQGTADAVKQNLDYLLEIPADYYLILSGDQLYRMDYQRILHFAEKTKADVVVSCLPVGEQSASRMGLVQIDKNFNIHRFYEKPTEPTILSTLKTPQKMFEKMGLTPDPNRPFLASMGIYLFKRDILIQSLEKKIGHDFGKDIIPYLVKKGKVASFLFDDYWEDIGTIESFFQANLSLTHQNPPFQCYNEHGPIYSHHHQLPAPKITQATIKEGIICEGSYLDNCRINKCILGPRSVIRKGTSIQNSYVMGNDSYASFHSKAEIAQFFIDENCEISNTIIDKDVRIGKNVKLLNQNKKKHYDDNHLSIRDGIIIVPKGAKIPDGYVI